MGSAVLNHGSHAEDSERFWETRGGDYGHLLALLAISAIPKFLKNENGFIGDLKVVAVIAHSMRIEIERHPSVFARPPISRERRGIRRNFS